MRSGPGLPIDELARRVALYLRVEQALFEILGRWASSTPETDVRVRFAADSYAHAWHAELWQDRLPDLRERTPGPPAGLDAVLEAVGAAETTVERLVGVYRVVVPRLAGAYAAHLEQASAISDGPVIRALDLARRDELAAWQAGGWLLHGLLGAPGAVAAAARHQADLESRLAASGGLR